MNLLRNLIVEWVRAHRVGRPSVLDVYYHLIGHGAKPDDAIAAITAFVDDLTAVR